MTSITAANYRCSEHFLERCRERAVPCGPDRLIELIRATERCWRRPDRCRYRLAVRFAKRRLLFVVWDAAAETLITAFWANTDCLASEAGTAP